MSIFTRLGNRLRGSWASQEPDLCSHQFFETQKASDVDNCVVTCCICSEVRVLSVAGVEEVYNDGLHYSVQSVD